MAAQPPRKALDLAIRSKVRDLPGSDGFTLIELMVVVAMLSILSAIAIRTIPHAVDRARLSSTVSSLRVVSDAIIRVEAQASDLPVGFIKVADLKSLLGPYVESIPTVDGWDNDLYYELIRVPGMHGEPDTNNNFRVYSYGKDGIPDAEIVIGRWVDFGSDVVIEAGQFLQTKW